MAAKQYIRKVEATSTIDFDEQQWPINVALLILGAFVAGVVAAASDFDDPRVLYNGWARMFGVLLTMGLLFGGMMYMQRRMMRRVQLCVLVSLLFHLWLALYLHQHYLRLLAQEEARRTQQEQTVYEPATIPDYHPEQLDQPDVIQSFEEPVETPEPLDPRQEPLKQEDSEPLPTIDKPEIEPDQAERQEPSPAEMQRAELSAPRRADQAAGAQVSRQEWKQRPMPDEPIPQPEIRPAGEQPTQPLADQVAAVRRRDAHAPRQERRTFDEPASQRQFDVAALARSARESQPEQQRPTTPAPSRQLTQPAEVAQTEAPAPEPVPAVEQPQPTELNPADALAERQSDPSRPIAGKRSHRICTGFPNIAHAKNHAAAADRRPSAVDPNTAATADAADSPRRDTHRSHGPAAARNRRRSRPLGQPERADATNGQPPGSPDNADTRFVAGGRDADHRRTQRDGPESAATRRPCRLGAVACRPTGPDATPGSPAGSHAGPGNCRSHSAGRCPGNNSACLLGGAGRGSYGRNPCAFSTNCQRCRKCNGGAGAAGCELSGRIAIDHCAPRPAVAATTGHGPACHACSTFDLSPAAAGRATSVCRHPAGKRLRCSAGITG